MLEIIIEIFLLMLFSHKEILTGIIVIYDTRHESFSCLREMSKYALVRRLDITWIVIVFFHTGGKAGLLPDRVASYYHDGVVWQRARETRRKKRTGEELWRRSVPGSDLSVHGTCHARNADAKREHHAAVIAEKPLSSSNLKFRGQHDSAYGVTLIGLVLNIEEIDLT